MPFEPGNQESKKADHRKPKIFRDALIAALKKVDSNQVEAIQRIANRLAAEAETGENPVPAIKEIAERIDGKVPQAHVGDDEYDPIREIRQVIRTIVDAKHPDGEGVQASPAAVTL